MKVVIAESEPLAGSLLRALLDDDGAIEIVGEAKSGSEAIMMAERLDPDAVFLDIDMPGGGGIRAAHELQKRCSAEIIFVTAHEHYAVDAFELGAVDYVLKPVRRPRLVKALDRVRARVRHKDENGVEWNRRRTDRGEPAFWVRTRQGKVRLQVSDIVWIEAARDHVYFHTSEKSYLHRITMEELEEKLQGSGLTRVQRSAFVRLDQVVAILRQGKTLMLELKNGTRVAVGPNYQTKALTALTNIKDERNR